MLVAGDTADQSKLAYREEMTKEQPRTATFDFITHFDQIGAIM